MSSGDTGEEPGVGVCDCGDPGADDPATDQAAGEASAAAGPDPDATPLPAAAAAPVAMPVVVAAFREAGCCELLALMGPSVQVRDMVSEKRLGAVLIAIE